MARLTIALIFITALDCFAQSLHDDIQTVYNFSPGKLSRDEQDKRIPLMDDFWNKVKSDTSKYLDELRAELTADGNPKFFYLEGGQLLLTLSKSKPDKQIVLEAIPKSDLNDVDRRVYVATLSYLAKAKLNTTEMALKILDDKDFRVFLPAHAFYFNQAYCLTYALLPTRTEYYLDPLIERFKREEDADTQKSIVTLLWFANTCSGNDFLNGLKADKAVDKEVADYAGDLLRRKIKKDDYYSELHNLSFDDLIEAQIASTNRMSDEAIYELDYITKLLRKSKCRN
jgi:hypothetical protein